MNTNDHHRPRTSRAVRAARSAVVPLVLLGLGAPASAAPPRPPAIVLLYTTAETTTSALVVWNTTTASDSLVEYSTRTPIPADAPRIHVGAEVTVHEVELAGLTPGTLYHYRVTSCARRGCASATGSFDTFPSCPDEVPAVSGSWQRASSPNVGGARAGSNQLLGVAAVSADEAWAVGWAQDPAAPPYFRRTLVQHFDGAAWSIVPSPNRGGDYYNVLHAVSAASAGDVWAVGLSHNGTLPSRTLIEHWDGVQWTVVPSPSPDTQLNELRAVAALSAGDAWAVGFRGGTRAETPLETLVLHWDGSSWSRVASPNVDGGANQLFGITALAADDIWAVGAAGGAPLALHWNGSAWSVVAVPRDAGLRSEKLTGVSGAGGNDVWAVGDGKGVFNNQTFATLRHWDGTHWTDKVCRAASASNPPDGYEGGGPDAYFTAVSAGAADDVWAVGVRGSGPMIHHWDGQAWTRVTHPRAFPNAAVPWSVAALGGGAAWSVGLEVLVDPSGSVSPDRTLVYRYVP
jgi:hypothetical protein